MVKLDISNIDVTERLSDLYAHLTTEQRALMEKNYTIQSLKKNEMIYFEGDVPEH